MFSAPQGFLLSSNHLQNNNKIAKRCQKLIEKAVLTTNYFKLGISSFSKGCGHWYQFVGDAESHQIATDTNIIMWPYNNHNTVLIKWCMALLTNINTEGAWCLRED